MTVEHDEATLPVMKLVFLSHFLQYYSLWALSANKEMQIRMFEAELRDYSYKQINSCKKKKLEEESQLNHFHSLELETSLADTQIANPLSLSNVKLNSSSSPLRYTRRLTTTMVILSSWR